MSWFSLSSLLEFPSGYSSVGRCYFKPKVRRKMSGNNSKRNQWAQSGVLKASPNKQCWLVSGRYCHVHPNAHTQKARRIRGLQARSPDTSSYSAWVTATLGKENWAWAARLWCLDRWVPLCRLQVAQTLMEPHQDSWKALRVFGRDFTITAWVVAQWHLAAWFSGAFPLSSHQ